jgi:hypothetical protein
MELVLLIVLLALLGYFTIYIRGRYYLRDGFTAEGFKAAEVCRDDQPPVYDSTAVLEELSPDAPYATTPIYKLEDYDTTEYGVVFQNEGNRVASKRMISDAMTRYPMSWTMRPPCNELFQNKQEAFVDAAKRDAETPTNTDEFNSISGKKEQPPDKDALEEEERKILQMYQPEDTKDLINYSIDDASRLVKRLYDKRGLVADVQESKQGPNVFEIVEVTEKNPVIVYEEDVQANREVLRGENAIQVPQVVNDLAAGLDPYFEPRSRVRMNRHDYYKWTPGLERSFAPTYTAREWY